MENEKITFGEYFKKNGLFPTLFILLMMVLLPVIIDFNGYDFDIVAIGMESFLLLLILVLYFGNKISYKKYLEL